MDRRFISLETRLRNCRNVSTLGVRPNFSDYSPEEIEKIRSADRIYYPSSFYSDLFAAMGKSIFPSAHTYRFAQDKIKQSALFDLLDIPRPKTRTFYGKKRFHKIRSFFQYPFIGKLPRGSALGRGVFLLGSDADLEEYLAITKTAYIQEYLPIKGDIRIVVISGRIVCAYWRIAAPGEFRSNVEQGAEIRFDPIPEEARRLAVYTANRCGWDDVGLDICVSGGRYYVLEGNMKYGRQGFGKAGIDYFEMMEKMLENGNI